MGPDCKREDVKAALVGMSAGTAQAEAALMTLVYDELRALAGGFLKRERPGHTLEPTALVHEVWMRLASEPDEAWTDVAHFKAVAVRAMRWVLVDHARRRASDKRGGDWRRVTLSGSLPDVDSAAGIDVLDLDRALERLESLHARQARVVEMRFLGGLTVKEVAHVLGVDRSTVDSDWAMARMFLASELGQA